MVKPDRFLGNDLPNGEIRGFLSSVPEPSAIAILSAAGGIGVAILREDSPNRLAQDGGALFSPSRVDVLLMHEDPGAGHCERRHPSPRATNVI
jgi:hypothetical protein